MSGRQFSEAEALERLVSIEQNRAKGVRVHIACRLAGITDTTYYSWRKRFGVAAQKAAKTLNSPATAPQT